MSGRDRVVVEVALNGSRTRQEQPNVPYTPEEVASEVSRCAAAGATIFHIHARADDGGWSADPTWYAEAHRRIRAAVPDALISVTSIRPAGVAVSAIVDLLGALAAEPATRADLMSINLGHIVTWQAPDTKTRERRTVHYPNAHDEIVALLAACEAHEVVPELGVMDLGFVSNAVVIRDEGRLPERPWFLVELDGAEYGDGVQVAPSTVANYEALAAPLRASFPGASWAAHGQRNAGYAILRRALEDGSHVRVGFEDAIHLPDGRLAGSNADLVAWVVNEARARGRAPATPEETRTEVGGVRSQKSEVRSQERRAHSLALNQRVCTKRMDGPPGQTGARGRRSHGARTTVTDGPHPHGTRGEEGKTEGERCRGVGARCVVGPGMGLVADDGEGLGMTQVSSGAADDVLAGTGKIGCCPGPRPPTGGRPLRE